MNNDKRTSKQMNNFIRRAAGYGLAEAETPASDAPRQRVNANAGSGLVGPMPDVETSSQKINRFIRRLAGRGW